MVSKKINITFVTPNLLVGGAERVISFLAKEFDTEKFNVTLVVFGYKKDVSYDIEGLNVIFFNKTRVLYGIPNMIFFLMKNKPDVVLSVLDHLNAIVAYLSIFFPKIKFIAREVNVMSVLEAYNTSSTNKLFDLLYKHRFKYFDTIICQSQDMRSDFISNYNVNPLKLHVINNPITATFVTKSARPRSNVLKFITVARLSKQKGHDRLLNALSNLNIPFQYTLIGSGPEKDAIFQLIENHKLKDKVLHIPFTNEVHKYLADSDVYLQGSYVEGFPNAVIESCAVGTPVLAFNALGGLNEIIINNVNGFLIDDENQFLKHINEIYNNDIVFSPNKVSESVTSKFNKDKIIDEYEDLVVKTSNS